MQLTFSEFKKNKNLPFFNFYHLAGEDHFVHKLIINEIAAKYIPQEPKEGSCHTFEAKKDSPVADLISLIRSYSLFSEYRLINIKNADLLDKSSLSKLIEAFEEMPQETIIVMTSDASLGRGELESFIKKKGCSIKCVLTDAEILDYIKNKTKRDKIEIQNDAAHLLINKIGHNLGLIDIEVEKLSSYAKGGYITKQEVEKMVAKNTFSKIYHFSDFIAKKDLKEAVFLLEELEKEEGKDFIYMVLGYLNKHFKNLLSIKAMAEEGVSANKIAENLGMRMDYYFKICLKQAAGFSIDELLKFFEYFQKADFSIKNNQDPVLTLELMLLAMCKK